MFGTGCGIFARMKLRDRYPHLQNPAVVKALVLQAVYASMALENQAVSMDQLDALYAQTEPSPAPVPPDAFQVPQLVGIGTANCQ